jgi:hypothetical protein
VLAGPLPPAPSPLVPRGEGENCNCEQRRASREPLTPGPTPANCAGEGRIRSRYDRLLPFSLPHAVCGRRGGERSPPSRGPSEALRTFPNHPSPEVGGGVARRREERAKGRAGERASREAGRGGKPSHAVTRPQPSRTRRPHQTRSLSPLPRTLRERVASHGEPGEGSLRKTPPPGLGEGSPAVARNERKAGRGRGPPAQRAVG